MVVMARPREPKPQSMTEFGRTLYALMLDKGVEYRQDLADMLTESGYNVTQQTVSNYMNGKRKIAEDFPLFVAEVLNLSDDERIRLARAYAYGATRLTETHVERIQAFRKQMRIMRGEDAGGSQGSEG